MPVDLFSKADFEAALPCYKDTGLPCWSAAGMIQGEEAYLVAFSHPDDVRIMVRSSVDASGYSAGCGEDSIRCWLVYSDGTQWRPLGSKVSRWTTRVTGWQERLLTVLRTLASVGLRVRRCPCGAMQGVFKVKKEGKNKGRWFLSCTERGCNRTPFQWLSDSSLKE